MQIQRVFAFTLLAASALCLMWTVADVQPSLGSAPSATHPVPKASQLLKVTQCRAALNVTQTSGWHGYAPGYYGRYGGYWGDPWGARYYEPGITTTNPEMAIDYTNITQRAMKEIQFGLIANGNLVAEARDVGTFSPGVEIKHKFGIPASTFPINTGLPQCVPLVIVFEDGTKWRNPALPPKNEQIYTNPTHH